MKVLPVGRPKRHRVWEFFFSSRRRHTIWTGDWSSDVCSSDLGQPWRATAWSCLRRCRPGWRRSEERRVGKECRSRRSPCHEKKNNRQDQKDQQRSDPSAGTHDPQAEPTPTTAYSEAATHATTT